MSYHKHKSRILVLASTFPRWEGDTEPPFIRLLTEELDQQDHEIIVLVPHAGGAKFFERIKGVEVVRFPYFWPFNFQRLCYEGGVLANMRKGVLAKIQIPLMVLSELVYTFFLTLLRKPSVIHAHWIIPQGLIGTLVGKITGTPVIVTAHGSDIYAFRKGFGRKINHWVLKQADRVSVNSNVSGEVMKRDFACNKVEVIPMGIDPLVFTPKAKDLKLKQGIAGKGRMILCVGRMVEQKGFQYVIEAMGKIVRDYPDTKLVLIGGGPYEDQLKNKVNTLGLKSQVVFLGKVVNNELPRYYASADIFIGPSITLKKGDTESFGVVFLEALACGASVISTNIGGIGDIVINEQTGLVVEPNNEDQIARAVSRIIKDDKLRNDLYQRGIEYVGDKFTWEKVASRFGENYQQLSAKYAN